LQRDAENIIKSHKVLRNSQQPQFQPEHRGFCDLHNHNCGYMNHLSTMCHIFRHFYFVKNVGNHISSTTLRLLGSAILKLRHHELHLSAVLYTYVQFFITSGQQLQLWHNAQLHLRIKV